MIVHVNTLTTNMMTQSGRNVQQQQWHSPIDLIVYEKFKANNNKYARLIFCLHKTC